DESLRIKQIAEYASVKDRYAGIARVVQNNFSGAVVRIRWARSLSESGIQASQTFDMGGYSYAQRRSLKCRRQTTIATGCWSYKHLVLVTSRRRGRQPGHLDAAFTVASDPAGLAGIFLASRACFLNLKPGVNQINVLYPL